MKKLLFILAFIPSLIFGQATVNLSPDSTLYDLHVLSTTEVSAYCDEYQAVYDAMDTPSSDVDAAFENTMVETMVDNGWWDDLDFFYYYGVQAQTDLTLNWITATNDATENGTVTLETGVGITSNGTTGYYNSGFNFGDGGTYNFTQDDALIGVYILTNVIETKVEFGTVGTGDMFFYVSAGSCTMRLNDDSNLGSAATNSQGLWIMTRGAGADKRMHHNGSSFMNQTIATTGVENSEIYLLAWNNSGPGLYSNRQVGAIFAGKYSTISISGITTAIETCQDAKGIGVIP